MKPYKEYIVKVEIQMQPSGSYTRTFFIKAHDAGEAEAIVHNRLAFTEPKYRVTEVKVVEE